MDHFFFYFISIRYIAYSLFYWITNVYLHLNKFRIYSAFLSSNWLFGCSTCCCCFCFSKYSSNMSVADFSISTGFESFSAGKVVVLSAGFMWVYGDHGPWIDGISVWFILRNRISLEFPFWVRRRFTHFMTSSCLLSRRHIQWRSPFKYSATATGIRWRRGFTYTTTPGLLVEKSSKLFSKKSLKIQSNWYDFGLTSNSIWKYHVIESTSCLCWNHDFCRTSTWSVAVDKRIGQRRFAAAPSGNQISEINAN